MVGPGFAAAALAVPIAIILGIIVALIIGSGVVGFILGALL